MENVFSEAYQHLLVLKGVGQGLVSTADVISAARRFRILDDRIPELYSYLMEQGMDILTPEEKIGLLSQKAENESIPNEGLDCILDAVLASDLDDNIRQQWLIRLYNWQNTPLRAVAFMKIAGMAAEEIAAQLSIPLEDIYIYEGKILQHYRMLLRTLTHRRASRRKPISDFYN